MTNRRSGTQPPSEAELDDLDEVCARIVTRDHVALRAALTRLRVQLSALAQAEGGRAGDLREAEAVLQGLTEAVLSHFAKEENILFPALTLLAKAARAGDARPPLPFPDVLHPIRLMEAEHERVEALLAGLGRIVEAFVPPPNRARPWRLWHDELERFERDLLAHARFEGTELFPRAQELERALL